MNVSGVGAPTPVPPTMPVGPAPSPMDRAPTEAAKAATPEEKVKSEAGKSEAGKTKAGKSEAGKTEAGKTEAGKTEEETTKLPPLKGLTLNEVRVLLGAMPASEATRLAAKHHNQPGVFDVYA